MIIESTNIKRKAIEIVHQKENDLSIDNQLFDFYLNKNQIIDLFDGIEKNPFMLKRIGTYLSNTLAF